MEVRELNLTDRVDVKKILMMTREVIKEFPELQERYEEIVILLASEKQVQDGELDKALETIFGFPVSTTRESVPGHGIGIGTKGCLQVILEPFENRSERMQRFVVRHECGHLLSPQTLSTSLNLLQGKYPRDFLSKLESLRNEYPVHICMIERYAEDWLQKPLGISETVISPRVAYRQVIKKEGIEQAIFSAIINSINILRVIYIYEFLFSKKPEVKEKFADDILRYRRYLNSWWHCLQKGTNRQLPEPKKILEPHHFESKESFFHQISGLLAKTRF